MRTKPHKQSMHEEKRAGLALSKCAINAEDANQQAKQKNSWLCGISAIWYHAMLCMHVAYRRRCRVHGMHQNIVVE